MYFNFNDCSTKISTATKADFLTVGEHIQRFNFSVHQIVNVQTNLQYKVQKIMIKLQSLNAAAKLTFQNALNGFLWNTTIWSSAHNMLEHYND